MRADNLERPLPWVLLALVFAGLCAMGAVAAISEQTPFSEYLNQARRCVELNDCPSLGGATGALPLFHGTSWIRLLSYSLRNGYALTRVQHIVLALMLLSIPTTFFFLQRYLGLRAATLGLGLYFPIILVGTDITILTYNNLTPLPLALYYGAIALFIETGAVGFGAFASIVLVAAVSAELGNIVMVPFHLALVAVAAPRPFIAVPVCALFLAVPFYLESADAAWAIIGQMLTLRFAAGFAFCVVLLPFLVRLRPHLGPAPSLPVADRLRVVMTAALLYATATIWLGNVFLINAVPAPRYFTPAGFPFMYLIAEGLGCLAPGRMALVVVLEAITLVMLPRAPYALGVAQVPILVVVTLYALGTIVRSVRSGAIRLPPRPTLWPVLATCFCGIAISAVAVFAATKRGEVQSLTLAEVEGLVSKLYGGGYTYSQLLGSLQGPAADDMMPLLTERDPLSFSDTRVSVGDPDFSLLVIKAPTAAIARTRGVIAAVPSSDSRSVIIVRDEPSYLEWTGMRRCSWVSNGASRRYLCARPLTDAVPHNRPFVQFEEPVPAEGEVPRESADDRKVRFEVPVRTSGSGVSHIIRTAEEWPATWRIVGVTGVDFEGKLPGAEVRLPDTRAGTGVVELEFELNRMQMELPWVWLPHVIEVAQDNEHLLEPFRAGRRLHP